MLCIILRKESVFTKQRGVSNESRSIKGAQGKHNLKDYEETYNAFD